MSIGALITAVVAGLLAAVFVKMKKKVLAAVAAIVASIALFVAIPEIPGLNDKIGMEPVWAWVGVIIAGLLAIVLSRSSPIGMVATIFVAVLALFVALPGLGTAFDNMGENIKKTTVQFFEDAGRDTPQPAKKK